MTIRSSVPSRAVQRHYLPGCSPVDKELERMAQAGAEPRGAVYTRREVVEFMLDLVGYVSDRPLHELSLLEPSFGHGDFLHVAVERLLEACRRVHDTPVAQRLGACIRAVELHRDSFDTTRATLESQLRTAGISLGDAQALSAQWLIRHDFLLADMPAEFDIVVGNPPYVRHELVPEALMAEYRALYTTVFDRADLYVPFIERSVRHLAARGKLAFICADRWVKNRYGGPLRELLSDEYHLHAYVDMVDTTAFHSDVAAYPAVFVIGREKTGATRVARRPEISTPALTALARRIVGPGPPSADGRK